MQDLLSGIMPHTGMVMMVVLALQSGMHSCVTLDSDVLAALFGMCMALLVATSCWITLFMVWEAMTLLSMATWRAVTYPWRSLYRACHRAVDPGMER